MKAELIHAFEQLLEKDYSAIERDVVALQKEYKKIWTSEFEKGKLEFIDAGGKGIEFEYAAKPEDTTFELLVERFKKIKKEHENKITAQEEHNYKIKKEIVAKINDLRQLSDNISAVVRKLHELQNQWKETGAVSVHKFKELQSDYSHAIEDIYYNLKIYRDLQEHDLKKNLENKLGLLEKLKNLHATINMKEVERLIRVYRNEWDNIGPVPNIQWESVKQEYKTALDEIYAKLKTFYKEEVAEKAVNLNLKKELVLKLSAFIDSLAKANVSKWNQGEEQIKLFQSEWRQIGRTNEKQKDKIWLEFSGLKNEFYEKRKEFFSTLSKNNAANRKIKSELITKAEELQNSTEWQKTGKELIELQEAWKKYPANGDREEHNLFLKFRSACNHFFDNRKKHFDSLDAEFVGNLTLKETIITKLKDATLGEDEKENRDWIKNIQEEWNQAGKVPMKDKKRITDQYFQALDAVYDKAKMEQKEKIILRYKNKIERFAHSENGTELLNKESDSLRKTIQEITSTINTYENNKGFFKSAKNDHPLLKEVNEKINVEKSKLEELTAKRKLVNTELGKMRELSAVK